MEMSKEELEELRKSMNIAMRRIGTLEKEVTLINTQIKTMREIIKKLITELTKPPQDKYVDKGQQEEYNKRERMWFEMWGLLSDTEDFGD